MTNDRIAALRQALALSPDSHPLRLLLAEALRDGGQAADAVAEYALLLAAGQLDAPALLPAAELALAAGMPDQALAFLHAARGAGVVEGVARAQAQADALLAARGVALLQLRDGDGAPTPAPALTDDGPPLTFSDVGGLDEVKKAIHRTIILPRSRPDLYRAYKRQAGGGALLYGPPGCGKTMIARATAGECGLPFFNVRIEDILDPYLGVSERNLHAAFERARAQAPGVLFLDEVDALAYARRKSQGGGARALVDQLLQELDAIGADNSGLLVLAATNAPWDVDDALLRPGRFDRRVFIPPPDAAARQHILALLLKALPTAGVDTRRIAQATPLFSGADLKALVDRAVDAVIEAALASGTQPPLTPRELEAARASLQPTTAEWLAQARNYVEFANHDGRYNEVAAFLRSPEARSLKR